MFILFDSNVWISQLGLQSQSGAAVRYFANRRNATVAIPEVVRLEVEERLTQRLLQVRQGIENGNHQLLPVLGELQYMGLPSENKVREAVAKIIPNFDVPTRHIPFDLSVARASMMRILRRIPPSTSTEQFRDGVIWEHCLELLGEGDVYLVSEDRDFCEHRKHEKGLAHELIREMQQKSQKHAVKLKSNLTQLLAELRMPIELDSDKIFEYILLQERTAVEKILEPNGFELSNGVGGQVDCFATEDANRVYFTFHLVHPCRDRTGAGRRSGDLTLQGSGSLDPNTNRPTEVHLSRVRLDYPDWKSGDPARGVVFLSAHFNAPTAHRIQFPLDAPDPGLTDL